MFAPLRKQSHQTNINFPTNVSYFNLNFFFFLTNLFKKKIFRHISKYYCHLQKYVWNLQLNKFKKIHSFFVAFLTDYMLWTLSRGFNIALAWNIPLSSNLPDGLSTQRRYHYLIKNNIHKIKTSAVPAAFEPAIPASERLRPRGHCNIQLGHGQMKRNK